MISEKDLEFLQLSNGAINSPSVLIMAFNFSIPSVLSSSIATAASEG